jgi:hypothetical protein
MGLSMMKHRRNVVYLACGSLTAASSAQQSLIQVSVPMLSRLADRIFELQRLGMFMHRSVHDVVSKTMWISEKALQYLEFGAGITD